MSDTYPRIWLLTERVLGMFYVHPHDVYVEKSDLFRRLGMLSCKLESADGFDTSLVPWEARSVSLSCWS